MSSDKTTRINKKFSEEFLQRLDEKPTERTNIIYQAIIFSLVLHVFFLFTTHQLTEEGSKPPKEEFIPIELEMLEPEQVEIVQQRQEEMVRRNGELKNVVANENSQQTDRVVNYRGMTQEQINQQVYNDLKNMEAEEFNRLSQEHSPVSNPNQSAGDKGKGGVKPDPNAWWKEKGSQQSYSGNVSAAFNVKGRDARQQPLPTYRCKSSGTVVIKVVVDQTGAVVETKIDEARSSMNDCLRSESEKYAAMWKFDYNASAAKKQDGTITFTFSSQ